MMRRRIVVAATGAAVAGCTLAGCGEAGADTGWAGTIDTLANGVVTVHSPMTGAWHPDDAWRVEEELRIGTAMGTGPDLFGQVRDIAVDDYGRIWVLESQANELRVFDADGRHVRTIGREGGGPREFNGPVGLDWDPDGHLWVADPRNARYSVFDTTGEHLATRHRPISGMMIPWRGGIDVEGRLYDYAFTRDGQKLVRFDSAFQPVDTFAVPDYDTPSYRLRDDEGRTRMMMYVPFAPRLQRYIDPRGRLWFGVTDRYRIVQTSLAGDTLRIIGRDHDPVPVTDEDRDSAVARLGWFREQGGEADPGRIPDVKPAFGSLFTDDRGFLWVEPSTARADRGRVMDVFDPVGRYLGRVRFGFALDDFFEPVIVGDRLYARISDELGVPYVVRARIVGREGGRAP